MCILHLVQSTELRRSNMEPPEAWEVKKSTFPKDFRSLWKGYIEDFGSMIRLQIHPASWFFKHGVLFLIRPFICVHDFPIF